MGDLGIVLALLVIGLLWLAAVMFGRDSRDGNDWSSRTTERDGPFHGGR
jgi:hypothetical protein